MLKMGFFLSGAPKNMVSKFFVVSRDLPSCLTHIYHQIKYFSIKGYIIDCAGVYKRDKS